MRPGAAFPLERRRVDTPDGDFLDLDFAPQPAPRSPLVVVLHGLEGSTQRRYISLMLRELFDRGLRGVGMNFRGCGGEPNRVARCYHSGDTGDLAHVIARLRDLHPGCPIGAAGFSLGDGSPKARITAETRLTTYRTARSAFSAVLLDPAGPCRESGKKALEWRDPGVASGRLCRPAAEGHPRRSSDHHASSVQWRTNDGRPVSRSLPSFRPSPTANPPPSGSTLSWPGGFSPTHSRVFPYLSPGFTLS